ncbi:hypothetical protein DN510_13590 [Burkholderia multivorans]|nr:hypothetical protein DN470_03135 [Burkholderia multivorans]RAB96147.1 hypothetical protein DN543_01815 [Burkholderia multivorans]RAE83732.1 hypothetical protein DN510_13590 [Burkholderia multivorans]RAF15159.1 hypothetical protein DN492_04525 [Burkholderia multivorans]RAG49574.1 hypothetical protein DN544_23930 [Burkholderia multivorans]
MRFADRGNRGNRGNQRNGCSRVNRRNRRNQRNRADRRNRRNRAIGEIGAITAYCCDAGHAPCVLRDDRRAIDRAALGGDTPQSTRIRLANRLNRLRRTSQRLTRCPMRTCSIARRRIRATP